MVILYAILMHALIVGVAVWWTAREAVAVAREWIRYFEHNYRTRPFEGGE